MLSRQIKVLNINQKAQYDLEDKHANLLLIDGHFKYYFGVSYSNDNKKFALYEAYRKQFSKSQLRIFEIFTAKLLYDGGLENGTFFQEHNRFTIDSNFYIYLLSLDELKIINFSNNTNRIIKAKPIRSFSLDLNNDIYIMNGDNSISRYSIDAKLKAQFNISKMIFNKFIYSIMNIFQLVMIVIASQTQYMIDITNLKIRWQRKNEFNLMKFIRQHYFIISNYNDIQLQQTRNGRQIRKIFNIEKKNIIEGKHSIYLVSDANPLNEQQKIVFEFFDIIIGVPFFLRWRQGDDIDFKNSKIIDSTIILWDERKSKVKLFEIERIIERV